ncbi:MAG: helix-turn-helix domain-containing protein [Gammaproteobacteria bacterium]|nr:helix-turn-helix domain-containing protein [Gammaproteobacteria bacterium]
MHRTNGKHNKPGLTKSLQRATEVFEALFEDDFAGRTDAEIAESTGIPVTTVWRALHTWLALGWVVQIHEPGTKAVRWRVSTRLARIATAYEQHALRRIHEVRNEYMAVTGKELRA